MLKSLFVDTLSVIAIFFFSKDLFLPFFYLFFIFIFIFIFCR